VQAKHAKTKQKTTAGPPPASKGGTKVAEYPIHVLVMENAIAKVESREKILGISLVDEAVASVIEVLPRSL
jgi:hypothetical protein